MHAAIPNTIVFPGYVYNVLIYKHTHAFMYTRYYIIIIIIIIITCSIDMQVSKNRGTLASSNRPWLRIDTVTRGNPNGIAFRLLGVFCAKAFLAAPGLPKRAVNRRTSQFFSKPRWCPQQQMLVGKCGEKDGSIDINSFCSVGCSFRNWLAELDSQIWCMW
jgi:hypothetical protein